MSQSYRIYLDACCLNRPFDDRNQPRILLEAEAVLTILSRCESGQWQLITSNALDVELGQTPDRERLNSVRLVLAIATIKVVISQDLENRSLELQALGFTLFDATHIASAERGQADAFLSTDDRLVKRAKRYAQLIHIPVENPVSWLMRLTESEGTNNA